MENSGFERSWEKTSLKETPKKVELSLATLCEQFDESLEDEGMSVRGMNQKRMMGSQARELNAKETAKLARKILTHDEVTEEQVRFIDERVERLSSMLLSALSDKEEARELIGGLNRLLEKR